MGECRGAVEAVILAGVETVVLAGMEGGVGGAVPALSLATAGFEVLALCLQILLERGEIGVAAV
jgi:tRNA U34 2-thiouridine synthase MnmA/TrmU